MLSYEEIVNAAIEYNGKPIEEGNEKFFAALASDEDRAYMLDNIYLEYFTCQVHEVNAHKITPDTIELIHEAAKLIYARHTGKVMMFDLTSAMSEFGASPWFNVAADPEVWVINYARRRLENDEGCISGPYTKKQGKAALKLISDLVETGLKLEDQIEPNMQLICYGRVVLEIALRYQIGMDQREFNADELAFEAGEFSF